MPTCYIWIGMVDTDRSADFAYTDADVHLSDDGNWFKVFKDRADNIIAWHRTDKVAYIEIK